MISKRVILLYSLMRKFPVSSVKKLSEEIRKLHLNDLFVEECKEWKIRKVPGGYFSEPINRQLGVYLLQEMAEEYNGKIIINKKGVIDLENTISKAYNEDKTFVEDVLKTIDLKYIVKEDSLSIE